MSQRQNVSPYFSRTGAPGLCHVGAADPGELNYNPGQLLDMVSDHLNVKNDAQLCRLLEVTPPAISKLRHMHVPVSADMLLRLHEVTDLTIRDLRFLMGDKRKFFRPIEIAAIKSSTEIKKEKSDVF